MGFRHDGKGDVRVHVRGPERAGYIADIVSTFGVLYEIEIFVVPGDGCAAELKSYEALLDTLLFDLCQGLFADEVGFLL